MFDIKASLQWLGDKIKREVNKRLDEGAIECGERIVRIARQRAPVDTGALRSSIGYEYNQASKTLRITVGEPYGLFQEFGTYNMAPHPFIRPALAIAGPSYMAAFGVDVSMNTALPIGYVPRVIQPHIRPKIAATQKKYSRGKVARTDLAFHHTGTPSRPVGGWAAHRNMSGLFKSRSHWN